MSRPKQPKWYTGVVLKGNQIGRTIGFPTANLDPETLRHIQREGVYATRVLCKTKRYKGLLYLGPRIVMHETRRCLEIYIMDFDQDIYGMTLAFQLGPFIRDVQPFGSLRELQEQITKDCKVVDKFV